MIMLLFVLVAVFSELHFDLCYFIILLNITNIPPTECPSSFLVHHDFSLPKQKS